jgi:hypothetical protein
MARMQWRTSGRRFLVALAVAVAFHLLLALGLGLWPRPVPKAPARRLPAMAVTLQGPRSQPAGTATPAPPGVGEPGSTRATGHQRRRPSPGATVAKGEQGKPTGSTLAREPGRGPLTKEEVAGEGLAREPGSAGVTTTLRDPIATLNPRGGPGGEPRQGPVHVPSREEQLVEEKTRVEGTLRGWTEKMLAEERARDPQDVYWRDMKDRLLDGFATDFEVSQREKDQPTSALHEALTAYQRAAESFGSTGSPVIGADGRSLNQAMGAGAVPPSDRGFAGNTSVEGVKAASDQQALAEATFTGGIAWNKKLMVRIQIIQSADGAIERAQVATTSGNKAYDGTALAQVRKLAGKGLLGGPPQGHRRTVWAFETDFTTMPPLPVAGCAIDALLVPRECYYPFKRTAHSRIYLEAIY